MRVQGPSSCGTMPAGCEVYRTRAHTTSNTIRQCRDAHEHGRTNQLGLFTTMHGSVQSAGGGGTDARRTRRPRALPQYSLCGAINIELLRLYSVSIRRTAALQRAQRKEHSGRGGTGEPACAYSPTYQHVMVMNWA